MMTLLVVAFAYLVAYGIAKVVVEVMDALHMVYRPEREDPQRPRDVIAVHPVIPSAGLDAYMRAVMHEEATHPHPHAATPIGDRLAALERTYQHRP